MKEGVLKFCYSPFPGESQHTLQDPGGKPWLGPKAQKKLWASTFILISTGRKGQGWAGRSGVCYSNDLSWLWSIGTVSRCLVPGPAAIRAGDDGPEWKISHKEGGGEADLISCSRTEAKALSVGP